MSAPAELDRARRGPGRLVPVQRVPPAQRTAASPWSARRRAPERYAGPERRSQSPIALLSREHEDVCREAVDPAEIAASLEASGLNDRGAKQNYGVAGIFELAEVLYRVVPRRPLPTTPAASSWEIPWTRHLGRGILYALPMLPYLAALRLLGHDLAAVATLLIASALTMSANHGISYVGHRLVGYGARQKAATFLRRALLVTLVGAGAGAALLVRTGALDSGPLIVAYAQLAYVVASTVIMVFRRDLLLVFSLVPCVVLSLVAVLIPSLTPQTRVWLALGLLGCVAGALWSAWSTLRRVERETRVAVSPRLIPPEFHRAMLHAGYGLVVSALLMFAVLDGLTHEESVESNTLIGIGMLPLIASLGLAEWHLHIFRRGAHATLYRTYHFPDFAKQVRAGLVRTRLGYAAALVVLTVLVLSPLLASGSVDPVLLWRHVGYGLLGLAIFEATLLVSCGLAGATTAWLALTVVADTAVRFAYGGDLLGLTRAHAAVFAALAAGLWATSHFRLVSPLRHQ